MYNHQISFDPSNEGDVKGVLGELLIRPNIEVVFKEVLGNSPLVAILSNTEELEQLKLNVDKLSRENEQLKNEKKELERDAYSFKEEADGLKKEVEGAKNKEVGLLKEKNDLASSLERLEKEKEDLRILFDNVNKENEDNKKEVKECKELLVEQQKNNQKKIEALEEEHRKELDNLKKDSEKEKKFLSNKLESYGVSCGSSDSSETYYFEVKANGQLEESMIKGNCLFKANQKNGKLMYTINVDGPVRHSLSDVDKFISPFCNITSKVEGANNIRLEKVGIANYDNTNFVVVEPVTVSLVKE